VTRDSWLVPAEKAQSFTAQCKWWGPPPGFFVTADSKELMKAIFVSADFKGVTGGVEIGVPGRPHPIT